MPHRLETTRLSLTYGDELRTAAPEDIAYALFRDGLDFVHVFINAKADDSNPLTDLPAFKAYARDVISRCQEPPAQSRMSMRLLDSYGLRFFMPPA